jgi:hypothetical protein
MHKLTPKIQEVIAFTRWLSENYDPWNNYFPSSKFYENLHTCSPCHQEQFLF